MIKERNESVELMRIMTIIMVIVLHAIYYGGVEKIIPKDSVNYILYCIFRACVSVCVNLFILITGYFGIDKEFKIKKICSIWLIILFYSVLGQLFTVAGTGAIFHKTVIFPVIHKRWYYATYYLALSVVLPFLNVGLNHMSKKMFQKCLIVLSIGFVLIPNIPGIPDLFMVQGGFSIVWFIYLYIIGVYIRKYGELRERISVSVRWLLAYLGVCCITGVLKYLNISQIVGYENQDMVYSYNFPMIVVGTLFLFISFLNIPKCGGGRKKIIQNISSTVFGIYLFHEHPIIRDLIWNEHFNSKPFADSLFLWIYVLFSALCIMGIGYVIEKVRALAFYVFGKGIRLGTKRIKNMKWRRLC